MAFSGSTFEISKSRALHVGRERVWSTLADYGAISSWAKGLDSSSLVGDGPVGMGSVRLIKVGPLRISEEIVVWEPPSRLAYRIDGLPKAVRSIVNAWQLEPEGEGTRARLTTTIEPWGFPGGKLLARLMGLQLAKTSNDLLASLAAHHSSR